jgi:23S rRNA pseudouridine2605 synthase
MTRPSDPPGRERANAVRLQKVLAGAGFGSRRRSEMLIAAGRVAVNGHRVLEQGVRVDPAHDAIAVDGAAVPTGAGLVWLALNKPAGVLSAMSDSSTRPCVGDFVGAEPRLFHVGRLDAGSEGLLLLTNDGTLAHRLTHPSYGVAKTYLAEVRGPLRAGVGRQLRHGVELGDGLVRVDGFRVADRSGRRLSVELVLHEGRKHVVRRLLEAVGYPVQRLVRTRIGPLTLGDLPPGHVRRLTGAQVRELAAAASNE